MGSAQQVRAKCLRTLSSTRSSLSGANGKCAATPPPPPPPPPPAPPPPPLPPPPPARLAPPPAALLPARSFGFLFLASTRIGGEMSAAAMHMAALSRCGSVCGGAWTITTAACPHAGP